MSATPTDPQLPGNAAVGSGREPMLSRMAIDSVVEALGGLCPARGGAFTPPTEDDLLEIERRFGRRLPDDYRSFIERYGGGIFCNTVGIRIHPNFVLNVEVFFGGGPDCADAFHIQRTVDVFEGRMPPTLMPIAECMGEGLICLGVSGSDCGCIYFWDREGEWASEEEDLIRQGRPVPPELRYRNLTLLADSFSDFLRKLSPEAE